MRGSDGFECLPVELSLYHYHGVTCVVTASSGVEGDYGVPELCQRGEIFAWSSETGGQCVGVEGDCGAVFVGSGHDCDQFVQWVERRIHFNGGFRAWSLLLVNGCFGWVELMWWWNG